MEINLGKIVFDHPVLAETNPSLTSGNEILGNAISRNSRQNIVQG
jgi:hypothetical protein